MILSTHAIVGGAIASLFPTHPAVAIVGGFASHFLMMLFHTGIIRCNQFRSGPEREID